MHVAQWAISSLLGCGLTIVVDSIVGTTRPIEKNGLSNQTVLQRRRNHTYGT